MVYTKTRTASMALLALAAASLEMPALADPQAGKVIIVKGLAEKVSAKGVKTKLIEGMPVVVGDAIVTGTDGAAKLVLGDMTEMNVGPASKFVIDDFQKNKPSIFSVVFGSLRAKVSKSINGDVKAIIRTRSSTMGVRGTDFQTVFNQQTQMTSLVTFEGAVAMVKTDPSSASMPVRDMIQNLTNPDQAVTVTQGQFSGVTAAQNSPTLPVKISPAQLESLKANNPTQTNAPSNQTNGGSAAANAGSGGTKFISPIPPGIDAKLVVGTLNDMKTAMDATMKSEGQRPLEKTPMAAVAPAGPPPEGFFDAKTGQVAPPAGGFVDMTTGLYVPPPPGSAFDPVAGVYVPPPSMGSFNLESGKYVPPAGFTLDGARGFIATGTTTPGTTAATAAASNGTAPAQTTATPGRSPIPAPLNTGGLFPGMDSAQFGSGMIAAPPPPGMTPGQMLAGPGMMQPSAATFVYSPGGPGQLPAGFLPPPGGFVPSFNGTQPQYPVYNPFVCPPYCDPQSQPGLLPPPPASGPSTTGVSFNLT